MVVNSVQTFQITSPPAQVAPPWLPRSQVFSLEVLPRKFCSSALGAKGVTFLRRHILHLGYVHCSVSAPSGQQLTTALKGKSRWREKQGKGVRKKAFPALGKHLSQCCVLQEPLCYSRNFSPPFSQALGFPPGSGGLLQPTRKKRDLHLSTPWLGDLLWISDEKKHGLTASVSADLESSPEQHRGESRICGVSITPNVCP